MDKRKEHEQRCNVYNYHVYIYIYISLYITVETGQFIHYSLICFAPSGDHSPSAPQTMSKNRAKMLPQPGLLLWNCPQRCRQVQWQGELVWLTWQLLGSRQIELGVGFGCRRCMKIKHWQSPALQKLKFSKLKMLQTPPGFAGQNLTNVSAGRESNTQHMQHATISATWICRYLSPCDVHKKRQNVTCKQGLRVPDVARSHATYNPTVRKVLDMAW